MDWKNKSPLDMANRVVSCSIIRSIGAEKVSMIKDEKIKNSFLLPCINDEGKEYFEIDWEFVLFDATEHQIGLLLDNFQPKQKKKESKIIT